MSRVKNVFRGKGGFTLIELLVVIVILGLLAAIIIPNILDFLGEGAEEAARSDLRGLQTEITAARARDGEWPGTGETSWGEIEDNEQYYATGGDENDPSDGSWHFQIEYVEGESVILTEEGISTGGGIQ